jgi:hypothetical protein
MHYAGVCRNTWSSSWPSSCAPRGAELNRIDLDIAAASWFGRCFRQRCVVTLPRESNVTAMQAVSTNDQGGRVVRLSLLIRI